MTTQRHSVKFSQKLSELREMVKFNNNIFSPCGLPQFKIAAKLIWLIFDIGSLKIKKIRNHVKKKKKSF